MEARAAGPADVTEVLRLAALMFDALGTPVDAGWAAAAASHLEHRLGSDVTALVVENPDVSGALIAVAAGSIHHRLPVPGRPQGSAGFVQWVSTEEAYRRRGASRAAMSALLAWFQQRGVEVVELHATPPGEPLYRSLGFTDPGARNLRWVAR